MTVANKENNIREVKIDPEFENLMRPLSKTEFSKLEALILKEGCRDPIVLWGDTIVDGHNRYRICKIHNIKPPFTNIEFSDREEARIWIRQNQDGRRNRTDQEITYDLGKEYESEKKSRI